MLFKMAPLVLCIMLPLYSANPKLDYFCHVMKSIKKRYVCVVFEFLGQRGSITQCMAYLLMEVWAIAKVNHIIGFHHTHANKVVQGRWKSYRRCESM